MKTIEFRRHSIKQSHGDTDLSQAGVERARDVGRGELHGKAFTHLFVSPMKRTGDTLEAFAQGAGDFPAVAPALFPPHVEVSQTEEGLRLWSGACHRAEQHGSDMLQGAFAEEPQLAQDISTKAAASFRMWVDALPDGAHALVIGHSPFMELIVYGLFGTVLPQLGFCEGFVITDEEGELRLDGCS